MSSIRFEQATCRFPGSEAPAIDALDLEVRDGELLVLVGPPASGKTTALRVIAGLEDLSAGRIRIGDRDVTRLPPKDRDVAIVFQNYALYPHLTVADNMGFPLKIAGLPLDEVSARVAEAADILGLTDLLDAKPNALTSAQRQQVALGRAVVRKPRVFLMDEPLVSLDPEIRQQTREQIVALQKRLGVTTVYATADQVEAMMMGDRVAVLDHGRVLQVGTPREVYDEPADVRVARFIGMPPMNVLRAAVTDGQARVHEWSVPVSAASESNLEQVDVGVRPEDLLVNGSPDHPGLPATVTEVIATADGDYVRVDVDGLTDPVLAKTTTTKSVGDSVVLVPNPDHVHLFAVSSGSRL